MPFRTDALGKLWGTQIAKDFRFRRAIIPRISKEVINLISRMLEPNWVTRATIYEVLSCDWFGLEPSLLNYTQMEEAALVKLNDFQPKKNMKAKKIKTVEMFTMEAFNSQNEEIIKYE